MCLFCAMEVNVYHSVFSVQYFFCVCIIHCDPIWTLDVCSNKLLFYRSKSHIPDNLSPRTEPAPGNFAAFRTSRRLRG